MKESVYDYSTQNRLSGVLTTPTSIKHQLRTAFLLLNSGLIHRVGPGRLYVKICRTIANAGYFAFRFDFSGIGDSLPREDNLPFSQSSIDDTHTTMDYLQKQFGIEKFILGGICAGGDVAFETAKTDKRVCAIVPIDFYNIPSRGYYIQQYKQRLRHLESWKRLLSGKSELWSHWKNSESEQAVLAEENTQQMIAAFDNTLTNNTVAASVNQLLKNGIKCCFLYSSESAGYYNYVNLFSNDIHPSEHLKMVCIENADHGFTLSASQDKLISAIADWLHTACP
jgi:pimeloyl-ACP methyl ester carboxylesterase